MVGDLQKIKTIVKHAANWVIRIMGSLILLILVRYALTGTQYMLPVSGHEFPIEIRDSVFLNLAVAALVLLLCVGLNEAERKISASKSQFCEKIVVIAAMLWQAVAGLCWVLAADRQPTADQLHVYNAAVGFLEGDYGTLEATQYSGMFPHQLGLAFVEELVFRILGNTDYHVMQVLFVLLNAGSVYFIYGILKELSGRLSVVVTGTVLAGSCIASIFYSSWIYGEVPWVFFSLLTAWMVAKYSKKSKISTIVVAVVSMTIGTLMRKNMLILIVAFCLLGILWAFENKDKKFLIAVIVACVLPQLCYQGIFMMYEMRSGIPHSDGVPTNAYIYIGMEETKGRFGWDFSNSSAQYFANDADTEKSNEIYGEMIRERWQIMKASRGYLRGFYSGKILSQWNEPLYQSLYFNFGHEETHNAKLTAFEDRLKDDLFDRVLWFADRLQFIIYAGCLLYFVFCVKKDSNLLQHLLAVAIIGGFLFSIIWEAKARYMYAYYMMMFPLAALGYGELIRLAEKYCFFRKKKI